METEAQGAAVARVFEFAPEPQIIVECKGRIKAANEAARRFFANVEAQLTHRTLDELLTASDFARVDEVLRLSQSSSLAAPLQVELRRRDGTPLHADLILTPVGSEWCLATFRESASHNLRPSAKSVDHSIMLERKRSADYANSRRREIKDNARDAQKLESLGVLASGVAHDFNSSLMIILGNASLLRATRNLTQKAIEHLEEIEEAGLRASRLIKHLLAYARTGRHNPQPTNLNDVIRDCLRFVQTSLGKKHKIRPELADELPTIPADRSQIEQIILNLCLNAKQAMPKGGEIIVSTRTLNLSVAHAAHCVPFDARAGEKVELSVKDAGCGMDEATITRIFDPFFTTKADGHGLGLAAVLGILRQHRGAARVESAPGRGTTMHIYLPVQRDD